MENIKAELSKLKEEMEGVNRIIWDGDNPDRDRQENRIHIADEILQKIEELKELLEEFDCI